MQRLEGLLAGASAPDDTVLLAKPSPADDMAANYGSVGLTLGLHPLAMLREKLTAILVTKSEDRYRMRTRTTVRVAGLVTHRQRLATASGVMFISIEDESGISNLIIWPSIQEEQRKEVLGSHLIVVQGELQNEEGVAHVVAKRVHDRSHWLGQLRLASRDFH